MKLRRSVVALSVAVSLAGLTACSKKATGQVVAVVNGEEVSLQELNAELNGQEVPPNVDKKLVMRQLLQRVVDRKLVVQLAKEQGLDKTPEYQQQVRRAGEELLVQGLVKKIQGGVKVPEGTAIDSFVASNPYMFSGRTRFTLDQIAFNVPADASQLKALESAHSIAAVAQVLDKLGVKYARGQGALDSATTPPEMLQKILALPAGEPFVVPSNGKMVASVITSKVPIGMAQEQIRPLATEALRNRQLQETSQKQLKTARASAKIEYQPGYEPPTDKPAAAK
jgi:peptidyl-prolyl cis-trans isomerase C